MTQDTISENERLRKELGRCIARYRNAVRWLRDARHYKTTYGQDLTYEGKPWKDNQEGSLAQDAVRAYEEAVNGVLYWRRRINNCNEKLMDLAGDKNAK